ncbi:MAG: hypothetical protein NVS4B12_27360 [Ktedonobacteraceae bacterium]
MNNNPDRCSQLRTLQDQLIKQINTLKESVQKVERDGVDSPVETINIIKSLEKTLHTTTLELQECPPETGDVSAASLQQQAPASIAAQTVRRWFPDAEQHDDDEGDSIIDEY